MAVEERAPNPYGDRITEILKQKAGISQEAQGLGGIGQIISALQGQQVGGYNLSARDSATKAAQYMAQSGQSTTPQMILDAVIGEPAARLQNSQLEASQALYNQFETERNRGNEQANILYERVNSLTGGDQAGNAMFIQEMIADPEEIDPSNMTQVLAKFSEIQKRKGYVSPAQQAAALSKRKELAEIKKLESEGVKPVTLGEGEILVDPVSGETIAKGIPKELDAPTGYRFLEDGSLEPIPGSKQAQEVEEGRLRQENALKSARTKAKIVSGKVKDIKNKLGKADLSGINIPFLKNIGETGFLGGIMRGVGGTKAKDIGSAVETIKANLAFDQLQEMRAASPTGGALGQVSERELGLLESAVANLDQSQSYDEFVKNLNAVETHYNNWLDTIDQAEQGNEFEGFEIIR